MNDLHHNPYLLDILSQPTALRQALAQIDLARLDPLTQAVQAGDFDRIVLTGMGASYYGLYPAWLRLAAAGLPAVWVDAAELVHHTPGLLTPRSLLWIASQSGHSAEVIALLRLCAARPPRGLLALTNDLSSPLAQAAGEMSVMEVRALLPLLAEPENTPSTRTYLHTLALGQLAALRLARADMTPHLAALHAAADGIAAYLEDWPGGLQSLGDLVERAASPAFSPVLVGRGLSYTSAMAGALNLQEAAKLPALGLQAAEFRHGPLEMAGPGLTVLVFAGENGESEPLAVMSGQELAGEHEQRAGKAEQGVRGLNDKLWQELVALGVNAWLVQPASPGSVPASRERGEGNVLPIPSAAGAGLPLAEIIPIQLLCLYLSQRAGITPGTFRHIGKVTIEE